MPVAKRREVVSGCEKMEEVIESEVVKKNGLSQRKLP